MLRETILSVGAILLSFGLIAPLTASAQVSPQLDFAIPRYSVYDCIPPTPTSFLCGNFLGQHGPDNLTGDNTRSNSVFIEIDPQYQNNGGTEVPITGILCSLDNAVADPCNTDPQHAEYTNLAPGQHTFKAILVTAFGKDPNPPVFTWKIISTTPPPTLRNQIIDNTWAKLCTNPTIANSPQGRLHCFTTGALR